MGFGVVQQDVGRLHDVLDGIQKFRVQQQPGEDGRVVLESGKASSWPWFESRSMKLEFVELVGQMFSSHGQCTKIFVVSF